MKTARLLQLFVAFVLVAAVTSYALWREQREPCYEVIGTLDGYGDRATQQYMGTVPVVRPTEQYALISVTRVIRSNSGGFSTGGWSIALGRDRPPLDTGGPLVIGHAYYFRFKRRWYDPRETYRMLVREPSSTESTFK